MRWINNFETKHILILIQHCAECKQSVKGRIWYTSPQIFCCNYIPNSQEVWFKEYTYFNEVIVAIIQIYPNRILNFICIFYSQ